MQAAFFFRIRWSSLRFPVSAVNGVALTGTIEALDRASKQKRKSLTLREAEPLLEIGSRYELEHWRNRLFAQFEDNAAALLPDQSLVKNKMVRMEEKPAEAVNPFDL